MSAETQPEEVAAGPSAENAALTRALRVYKYLFGITTFVILLVFAEPTIRRLSSGIWQRGHFPYVWTLSLDVHAVLGYSFLFAFLTQLFLGWRLGRGSGELGRAPSLHRGLGRALLFGLVPAFLIIALWVIVDRSTTIPPARSVIFRQHREMARIALYELLGFMGVLFFLAYRAIRRGDVLGHVDAVAGAFMVAAAIAIIRFLYALFWATRGGSPFSVVAMFLFTIAIVVAALAGCYALAGRLRANRWPLLALIAVTALIAVLGADQYTMMDDLPRHYRE